MSFSDYWKGPAHRQRADSLEVQLTDLQKQYAQRPTPRRVLRRLIASSKADHLDRQLWVERCPSCLAAIGPERVKTLSPVSIFEAESQTIDIFDALQAQGMGYNR